ncbi:MAG TPA: hypothetical protein ENJ09_12525 [Planctomycetes bacterium]|nr:hypothetical protein [Planctomycetota bacterium]
MKDGTWGWNVIAALILGAGGVRGQEGALPVRFPGPPPGRAHASAEGTELVLWNDILRMRYSLRDGSVRRESFRNEISGQQIPLSGELFRFELEDGSVVHASDLELERDPQALVLRGGGRADGRASQASGQLLRCGFKSEDRDLRVVWLAELLDGGNAVRETLNVHSLSGSFPLARIVTFDTPLDGCERIGAVEGSVLARGDVLFALEHPMATNEVRYPTMRVGSWDPTTTSSPEARNISFDVSDAVRSDGPVRVRFQYTRGGQRLDVFWVALLVDGREVSRDEHHGHTGDVDVDNEYDLTVRNHSPGARVTLVASASGDGGNDSFGEVTWSELGTVPRAYTALEVAPVQEGETLGVRTLYCATAPGQRRRSFLYDLERNRAHPYRPFLHYNTWYDLGYFTDFDESQALGVVRAFGEELVKKRGVRFDSFLFDDGWDDHGSVWGFHRGFPNGFGALGELARSYGAGPGVWLSPWGGYGKPHDERIAAGKAAGYETNQRGFALSAPKYFERFRSVCLSMVEEFGVNMFKFDGLGRKTGRYPGSRFPSDFAAAIQLISDIRGADPDIFINLTTGTWPSPFWLEYADSIWRGGYDHSFAGTGTPRQQWMTYRDAQTYSNVVRGGPLYPINSLMVHGVIFAPHANKLDTDPGGDLRAEIRTAFGMGTDLQELYVSPGLLSDENWDDLAQSAKWARARANVLVDVHWVGGDPGAGEVYGWAAWAPGRATLTLRNPGPKGTSFLLDPAALFELPPGAAMSWELVSPYADQRVGRLDLEAGEEFVLLLAPYEVLVFDAVPAKGR